MSISAIAVCPHRYHNGFGCPFCTQTRIDRLERAVEQAARGLADEQAAARAQCRQEMLAILKGERDA